jgi:fibronectin type 3 domain-containing protein
MWTYLGQLAPPFPLPATTYTAGRRRRVRSPKINSALDTATVYTDSTVVSGQTYYYATTAADSSGTESPDSNLVQAVVP